MGAALGLIGPLMSIGGALGGMFGGGGAGSVPHAPPVYQPTGQAQADQGIQGGINNQQGAVPQAGQTVQNLYNNPGAPGMQAGAGVAGAMGEAAGLGQFMRGQNLVNQGNSLVPYASQALQQGFDPQRAMYNQEFQQNTDQTRAGNEARGIDMTPYGGGVEADSNRKFNTSWDFNQLQREQMGASTAGGLLNQGASDIMQGSNLSGQAPGTFMNGASMPYNINQQIGMNQLGALGQGQQIQQTPIQNWMNYMQMGQGAAGIGTSQQSANVNQNQVGFGQNQQLGAGLGAGIQGLQKGWNNFQTPGWAGGGGSWGQNNPGAPGSSYQGPVQ